MNKAVIGKILMKGTGVVTKKLIKIELAVILVVCLLLAGCNSGNASEPVSETSPAVQNHASNLVRSNPAAIGFSLEDVVENDPFTSYTYDFTAFENNYMITVAPDETKTGLVLTLEDNNFGFSTFEVVPPENYSVYLPYSQKDASSVCTVIRGTDSEDSLPDILKIDFYLSNFDNEELPYSVCKMYSVINGGLAETRIYCRSSDLENSSVLTETMAASWASNDFVYLDYIPETQLLQAEPRKFMATPKVTANDDGSFDVSIITYTADKNASVMTYNEEELSFERNPLYYGYAVHAIAGEIYKYFSSTSLNVSDYNNYVEIPTANGETSQYFFKVDDPRFSTVQELRDLAEKYFAKNIVDEMFRSAPQQYRDIDGELYTIVGDGGYDDTLGKLIFTGEMEENADSDVRNITYYTKQEKFNDTHEMTGYIDGGNFTIEITDDEPGFLITQYRYPY